MQLNLKSVIKEHILNLLFIVLYYNDNQVSSDFITQFVADVRQKLVQKTGNKKLLQFFSIQGNESMFIQTLKNDNCTKEILRIALKQRNYLLEDLDLDSGSDLEDFYIALIENEILPLENLIEDINCPRTVLRLSYYSFPDYKTERIVLTHSNCPADLLEEALKLKSRDARAYVASNPNATLKMLEQCASDRDWQVRMAAAKNQNISADLISKLSKDSDIRVKLATLTHPSCPKTMLDEQSNSLGKDVLIELAKNTACSEKILQKLLATNFLAINKELLKNPASKEAMLLPFLKQWDEELRELAYMHPNCSQKTLISHYDNAPTDHFVIPSAIIKNPNCPPVILKNIVEDKLIKEFAEALLSRADFDKYIEYEDIFDWLEQTEYNGSAYQNVVTTFAEVLEQLFLKCDEKIEMLYVY